MAAIAAGVYHTCALMTGGGVKCWGLNGNGQLGDGTSGIDRPNPVDVCASGSGGGCTVLTGVAAFAAGGLHACAVTSGGGVKCWGLNINGQLGDGTSGIDRPKPGRRLCERVGRRLPGPPG